MLEFLPIVIRAYLGIVVSDTKIVGNPIENTVQWNAIQCNIVHWNAIQCNTVQWPLKCNTIWYNTIQYITDYNIYYNL